jgi:hypothetical protein
MALQQRGEGLLQMASFIFCWLLLAQAATLEEALPSLSCLVCDPVHTLAVGSSFRQSLLSLVACLVDYHLVHPADQDTGRLFSVALIKLLELAPHVSRCVPVAFVWASCLVWLPMHPPRGWAGG